MKVLFVGLAGTRVAWFRCVLPAMFWPESDGGIQDWCAMLGSPPYLKTAASWVNGSTAIPDMFSYDCVVLEQVRGNKWLDAIKKLQRAGITVLYETDDFLHGVHKVPDHEFKHGYTKDDLKQIRNCMRACDGMIVSTPYLAELYGDMDIARKIYICENGLDLGRYRLTKPSKAIVDDGHEATTILWSGATGHQSSVARWLMPISQVMREIPYSTFVSIGKAYADELAGSFEGRTMTVPFSALETYTAAMMVGDVAVAPAGTTDWHKSKSQLRAMESMALGIPVVADPFYRETVEEYGGGFIAENVGEARDFLKELVENVELREEISGAAKKIAHENFGMQHRVGKWVEAITDAVQSPSVR